MKILKTENVIKPSPELLLATAEPKAPPDPYNYLMEAFGAASGVPNDS